MSTRLFLLSLVICLSANIQAATAEPTEIVVRVLAKDAKFVGTEMGGAQVTLRDADTGKVLAQGLTSGTSGNTQRIMTDGHARRDLLSDDMSAKFSTTIDIDKPRRMTVTATGPLDPKHAETTVTSTQWVIPGKSINGGDGWVLELPGFAVSAIDPPTEIVRKGMSQKIALKAEVRMMCGCPIQPDSQWDSSKLEVAAIVTRDRKKRMTAPLAYAGQKSQFAGEIELADRGVYDVTIYAYDPRNGNTGVDRFHFNVR